MRVQQFYFRTFVDLLLKLNPGMRNFYGSLGEEAVSFFKESGLPETVLAHIWDLADITSTGRLSKDEFAVAMHLINMKKANNTPLPEKLPMPMVPPSLRKRVALSDFFSGEGMLG